MIFQYKTRRLSFSIRAVSFATLICFVTTTVAWGAPSLSTEYGVQNSEIKTLTLLDQIVIPPEIGSIQTVYRSELQTQNSGLVVHVEEAHGQPEGQENIERILAHLGKEYGLKTVYLEGAWKELDPENLRFFDDGKLNREFLEELNRAGLIGGVELFLSENQDPYLGTRDLSKAKAKTSSQPRVYGVEDLDLYKQNLEQFREIYAHQTETDTYLNDLHQKLYDRILQTSNAELRIFFKDWVFRSEIADQPFTGIERLAKDAEKQLSLDLTDAYEQYDWPQLVRFFKLQQLEKSGHEPRSTGHEDNEKLKQWLKENNMSAEGLFFETFLRSERDPWPVVRGAGHQDIRALVEDFYSKVSPKGFRFEDYPALTSRIGIAILSSELQAPGLYREIEKLNDLIFAKLAKTPEEKELIERYKEYRLLKKLFSLELTREEYQKLDNGWRLAAGENARISSSILHPPSKAVTLVLGFYKTAGEREQVMFERTLARMKALEDPNAVLVTGGFHSEGLLELFKQNGISYLRITPHITKPEKTDAYLDVMLPNKRAMGHGPRATDKVWSTVHGPRSMENPDRGTGNVARGASDSELRSASLGLGFKALYQDLGPRVAANFLMIASNCIERVASGRNASRNELIALLRPPLAARFQQFSDTSVRVESRQGQVVERIRLNLQKCEILLRKKPWKFFRPEGQLHPDSPAESIFQNISAAIREPFQFFTGRFEEIRGQNMKASGALAGLDQAVRHYRMLLEALCELEEGRAEFFGVHTDVAETRLQYQFRDEGDLYPVQVLLRWDPSQQAQARMAVNIFPPFTSGQSRDDRRKVRTLLSFRVDWNEELGRAEIDFPDSIRSILPKKEHHLPISGIDKFAYLRRYIIGLDTKLASRREKTFTQGRPEEVAEPKTLRAGVAPEVRGDRTENDLDEVAYVPVSSRKFLPKLTGNGVMAQRIQMGDRVLIDAGVRDELTSKFIETVKQHKITYTVADPKNRDHRLLKGRIKRYNAKLEINPGGLPAVLKENEMFKVILGDFLWYENENIDSPQPIVFLEEGCKRLGQFISDVSGHLAPQGSIFILFPGLFSRKLNEIAQSAALGVENRGYYPVTFSSSRGPIETQAVLYELRPLRSEQQQVAQTPAVPGHSEPARTEVRLQAKKNLEALRAKHRSEIRYAIGEIGNRPDVFNPWLTSDQPRDSKTAQRSEVREDSNASEALFSEEHELKTWQAQFRDGWNDRSDLEAFSKEPAAGRLSPREKEILAVAIRKQGKVFFKNTLIAAIIGATPQLVATYLFQIRKKIRRDASHIRVVADWKKDERGDLEGLPTAVVDILTDHERVVLEAVLEKDQGAYVPEAKIAGRLEIPERAFSRTVSGIRSKVRRAARSSLAELKAQAEELRVQIDRTKWKNVPEEVLQALKREDRKCFELARTESGGGVLTTYQDISDTLGIAKGSVNYVLDRIQARIQSGKTGWDDLAESLGVAREAVNEEVLGRLKNLRHEKLIRGWFGIGEQRVQDSMELIQQLEAEGLIPRHEEEKLDHAIQMRRAANRAADFTEQAFKALREAIDSRPQEKEEARLAPGADAAILRTMSDVEKEVYGILLEAQETRRPVSFSQVQTKLKEIAKLKNRPDFDFSSPISAGKVCGRVLEKIRKREDGFALLMNEGDIPEEKLEAVVMAFSQKLSKRDQRVLDLKFGIFSERIFLAKERLTILGAEKLIEIRANEQPSQQSHQLEAVALKHLSDWVRLTTLPFTAFDWSDSEKTSHQRFIRAALDGFTKVRPPFSSGDVLLSDIRDAIAVAKTDQSLTIRQPAGRSLQEVITKMREGVPLIPPKLLPKPVQTAWGVLDFSKLNDPQRYFENRETPDIDMARDLTLAHLLGWITLKSFHRQVSPQTQVFQYLHERFGFSRPRVTSSWTDWTVTAKATSQAVARQAGRFFKQVSNSPRSSHPRAVVALGWAGLAGVVGAEEAVVRERFAGLPPKHQKVVKLRRGLDPETAPLTDEEIAVQLSEEFGILADAERVRKIEKEAIARMRAPAEGSTKSESERKEKADASVPESGSWRRYFNEPSQGPKTYGQLSVRAQGALRKAGIYSAQQFEYDLRPGHVVMELLANTPRVWEASLREIFFLLRNAPRSRFSSNVQSSGAPRAVLSEAEKPERKTLPQPVYPPESKNPLTAVDASGAPYIRLAAAEKITLTQEKISERPLSAAPFEDLKINTGVPENTIPSEAPVPLPVIETKEGGTGDVPVAVLPLESVPEPAIEPAGMPEEPETVKNSEPVAPVAPIVSEVVPIKLRDREQVLRHAEGLLMVARDPTLRRPAKAERKAPVIDTANGILKELEGFEGAEIVPIVEKLKQAVRNLGGIPYESEKPREPPVAKVSQGVSGETLQKKTYPIVEAPVAVVPDFDDLSVRALNALNQAGFGDEDELQAAMDSGKDVLSEVSATGASPRILKEIAEFLGVPLSQLSRSSEKVVTEKKGANVVSSSEGVAEEKKRSSLESPPQPILRVKPLSSHSGFGGSQRTHPSHRKSGPSQEEKERNRAHLLTLLDELTVAGPVAASKASVSPATAPDAIEVKRLENLIMIKLFRLSVDEGTVLEEEPLVRQIEEGLLRIHGVEAVRLREQFEQIKASKQGSIARKQEKADSDLRSELRQADQPIRSKSGLRSEMRQDLLSPARTRAGTKETPAEMREGRKSSPASFSLKQSLGGTIHAPAHKSLNADRSEVHVSTGKHSEAAPGQRKNRSEPSSLVKWKEGIRVVKRKPKSDGSEIRLIGQPVGDFMLVQEAQYAEGTYFAKRAKDREALRREDQEKFVTIPQGEVMEYLKSENIKGLCLAEHYLITENGERVILFPKIPDGKTIEQKVHDGEMSQGEVLRAMFQAVRIVEELHRVGVYHWDINPRNIWVRDNGEVILLDFDFAFRSIDEFFRRHLQNAGAGIYISVDRVTGERNAPSEEEEVFSLAMSLLDLLNLDSRDIRATSQVEYVNVRLGRLQAIPDLPSQLFDVLRYAVENGHSKYRTVTEFRKDFEKAIGLVFTASDSSVSTPTRQELRNPVQTEALEEPSASETDSVKRIFIKIMQWVRTVFLGGAMALAAGAVSFVFFYSIGSTGVFASIVTSVVTFTVGALAGRAVYKGFRPFFRFLGKLTAVCLGNAVGFVIGAVIFIKVRSEGAGLLPAGITSGLYAMIFGGGVFLLVNWFLSNFWKIIKWVSNNFWKIMKWTTVVSFGVTGSITSLLFYVHFYVRLFLDKVWSPLLLTSLGAMFSICSAFIVSWMVHRFLTNFRWKRFLTQVSLAALIGWLCCERSAYETAVFGALGQNRDKVVQGWSWEYAVPPFYAGSLYEKAGYDQFLEIIQRLVEDKGFRVREQRIGSATGRFLQDHVGVVPPHMGISTPEGLRVYDQSGEVLDVHRRRVVFNSFEEVPEVLKQLLFLQENQQWEGKDNPIIEWKGLARIFLKKVWYSVRYGGSYPGGASTIGTQLAKFFYYGPTETWRDKLFQMTTAELGIYGYGVTPEDIRLAKEEQFVQYVNGVYLGSLPGYGHVRGFAEAAYAFFGKSPEEMTPQEWAFLVPAVKNPSIYMNHPQTDLGQLLLEKLYRSNSALDSLDPGKEPEPITRWMDRERGPEGWVSKKIRERILRGKLSQLLGLPRESITERDITVQTTFNGQLQKHVENELEKASRRYNGQVDIGFLMTDQTGRILALAETTEGDFSSVLNGRHSMGSTAKLYWLIYYLNELPDTSIEDVFMDSQFELDTGGKIWRPQNVTRTFSNEPMTLREAFYHSNNTVFLRLADVCFLQTRARLQNRFRAKGRTTEPMDEEVFKEIEKTFRRYGYGMKLQPHLASVLGASGDNLRQMVGLLQMLANYGVRIPLNFVEAVRLGPGSSYDTILDRAPDEGVQVIRPEVAEAVLNLMEGTVQEGTAHGMAEINDPENEVSVGGKTGTEQDNKSAAFVGTVNFEGARRAFGITLIPRRGVNSIKLTSHQAVELAKEMMPGIIEAIREAPAAPAPEHITVPSQGLPLEYGLIFWQTMGGGALALGLSLSALRFYRRLRQNSESRTESREETGGREKEISAQLNIKPSLDQFVNPDEIAERQFRWWSRRTPAWTPREIGLIPNAIRALYEAGVNLRAGAIQFDESEKTKWILKKVFGHPRTGASLYRCVYNRARKNLKNKGPYESAWLNTLYEAVGITPEVLSVYPGSNELRDMILEKDRLNGVRSFSHPQPSWDDPVVAIFDVHGTLIKADWKQVYAHAFWALTGREMDSEWFEEHILFKEEKDIEEALDLERKNNGRTKTTLMAAEQLIVSREHIWKNGHHPAIQGAAKFLKALNEKGIPIAVTSGSSNEIIIPQLKEAGLLQYIPEDSVFGEGKIQDVAARYPDHTVVYFDDTGYRARDLPKAHLFFMIPQGEPGTKEFKENAKNGYKFRADYTLSGKYPVEYLMNILTVPEESQSRSGELIKRVEARGTDSVIGKHYISFAKRVGASDSKGQMQSRQELIHAVPTPNELARSQQHFDTAVQTDRALNSLDTLLGSRTLRSDKHSSLSQRIRKRFAGLKVLEGYDRSKILADEIRSDLDGIEFVKQSQKGRLYFTDQYVLHAFKNQMILNGKSWSYEDGDIRENGSASKIGAFVIKPLPKPDFDAGILKNREVLALMIGIGLDEAYQGQGLQTDFLKVLRKALDQAIPVVGWPIVLIANVLHIPSLLGLARAIPLTDGTQDIAGLADELEGRVSESGDLRVRRAYGRPGELGQFPEEIRPIKRLQSVLVERLVDYFSGPEWRQASEETVRKIKIAWSKTVIGSSQQRYLGAEDFEILPVNNGKDRRLLIATRLPFLAEDDGSKRKDLVEQTPDSDQSFYTREPTSSSADVSDRGLVEVKKDFIRTESRNASDRNKQSQKGEAAIQKVLKYGPLDPDLLKLLRNMAKWHEDSLWHMVRVMELGIAIAGVMGSWDHPELIDKRILAHSLAFHDIGKLWIPQKVLTRPGQHNNKEWNIMKTHAAKGWDVLEPLMGKLGYLREVAENVIAHQEKFNGTGYPKGLKGTGIPLIARIAAVADSFDAMAWPRVYKDGVPPFDVMAELIRCAGIFYDPEVVAAIFQFIFDPKAISFKEKKIYPMDTSPFEAIRDLIKYSGARSNQREVAEAFQSMFNPKTLFFNAELSPLIKLDLLPRGTGDLSGDLGVTGKIRTESHRDIGPDTSRLEARDGLRTESRKITNNEQRATDIGPASKLPFSIRDIQQVYLDLEGVILNTDRFNEESSGFVYAMMIHGVKDPKGFVPVEKDLKAAVDLRRANVGQSTREQYSKVLEELGRRSELDFYLGLYNRIRAAVLQKVLKQPLAEIRRRFLMPGAEDFLAAMKTAGKEIHLITVGTGSARLDLFRALGLQRFFTAIHPVLELDEKIHVLKKLAERNSPGAAFYVDDSPKVLKALQTWFRESGEKPFWVIGLPASSIQQEKMQGIADILIPNLGVLLPERTEARSLGKDPRGVLIAWARYGVRDLVKLPLWDLRVVKFQNHPDITVPGEWSLAHIEKIIRRERDRPDVPPSAVEINAVAIELQKLVAGHSGVVQKARLTRTGECRLRFKNGYEVRFVTPLRLVITVVRYLLSDMEADHVANENFSKIQQIERTVTRLPNRRNVAYLQMDLKKQGWFNLFVWDGENETSIREAGKYVPYDMSPGDLSVLVEEAWTGKTLRKGPLDMMARFFRQHPGKTLLLTGLLFAVAIALGRAMKRVFPDNSPDPIARVQKQSGSEKESVLRSPELEILNEQDVSGKRFEARGELDALVLDLGGVIFDHDLEKVAQTLINEKKIKNKDVDAVTRICFFSAFYAAFERDEIDEDVFRERLSRALEMPTISRDDFLRIWNGIFTLKQETVEFIRQQKILGRKVFFLTDASRTHIRFLKEKYPEVFGLADGLFTSYDLHARKGDGDGKIYEEMERIALAKYGVPLAKMCFFDDRESNVDGALAAGMPADVFTDARDAEREIDERVKRYNLMATLEGESWAEHVLRGLSFPDLGGKSGLAKIVALMHYLVLAEPIFSRFDEKKWKIIRSHDLWLSRKAASPLQKVRATWTGKMALHHWLDQHGLAQYLTVVLGNTNILQESLRSSVKTLIGDDALVWQTVRNAIEGFESYFNIMKAFSEALQDGQKKVKWPDGTGNHTAISMAQAFDWFAYQILKTRRVDPEKYVIIKRLLPDIVRAGDELEKAYAEAQAEVVEWAKNIPDWNHALKQAEEKLRLETEAKRLKDQTSLEQTIREKKLPDIKFTPVTRLPEQVKTEKELELCRAFVWEKQKGLVEFVRTLTPVPGVDFVNAALVPWAETIREKTTQTDPGTENDPIFGSSINRWHYWSNVMDMRKIELAFIHKALTGRIDHAAVRENLVKQHVLLIMGESGDNYYYPEHLRDAFPKSLKLTPEIMRGYAEAMHLNDAGIEEYGRLFMELIRFFQGPRENFGTFEQLLFDLHRMIIAPRNPDYCTMPFTFKTANHSFGMNNINGFRRLLGVRGIYHGTFDRFLLDRDPEKAFRAFHQQFLSDSKISPSSGTETEIRRTESHVLNDKSPSTSRTVGRVPDDSSVLGVRSLEKKEPVLALPDDTVLVNQPGAARPAPDAELIAPASRPAARGIPSLPTLNPELPTKLTRVEFRGAHAATRKNIQIEDGKDSVRIKINLDFPESEKFNRRLAGRIFEEQVKPVLHLLRGHPLAGTSKRMKFMEPGNPEHLVETVVAIARSSGSPVLLNLAGAFANALDAIADRKTEGGRFTPQITLEMRREGKDFVLEISDNGVGISKDILEVLFRQSVTTKRGNVRAGHAGVDVLSSYEAWFIGELGGSLELDTRCVAAEAWKLVYDPRNEKQYDLEPGERGIEDVGTTIRWKIPDIYVDLDSSPVELQTQSFQGKTGLTHTEIRVAHSAAQNVFSHARILEIGRAEFRKVFDSLMPAAHASETPDDRLQTIVKLVQKLDQTKLKTGMEQVAVIFPEIPQMDDTVLETLEHLIANSRLSFQIIVPGASQMDLENFRRQVRRRCNGGNLKVGSDETRVSRFFQQNSENGLVYDLRNDEGEALRLLVPQVARSMREKQVLSVYAGKDMTLSQKSFGLIAAINTLFKNKDAGLWKKIQPLSAILQLAENIQITAEADRAFSSAA